MVFKFQIASIVSNNDTLFDFLYPRTNTHEELIADRTKRKSLAHDKVSHNAFGKHNMYYLNYYISACNHSCRPNATTFTYMHYEIPISAMFAMSKIKKGNEITIMYNLHAGHCGDGEHGEKINKHDLPLWICHCDLSKQDRIKRSDVIEKITTSIAEKLTKRPFIIYKVLLYR